MLPSIGLTPRSSAPSFPSLLHWTLTLLAAILVAGCASWGENLTSGALDAIDGRRDSLVLLTGRLTAAARDSALSEATRRYVQALLGDVTGSLNTQAVAIRDSLLGAYTMAWVDELRNNLLGDRTGRRVAALRDELIGARTNAYLMDIREGLLGPRTVALLASMRDELLGDNTTGRISFLRDELLGATTRTAIDSLVYSAVSSIGRGYRAELQPIVEEQGSFIKRNATELLITAGAILLVLIVVGAILFARSRRYRKMIDMMTVQIDRMPDRQAYDELTGRIKRQAQDIRVESELQKMLRQNGLQEEPAPAPAG